MSRLIPDEDLDKVTRIEIIDDDGLSYTNWVARGVFAEIQDDGRTLKVFTVGHDQGRRHHAND